MTKSKTTPPADQSTSQSQRTQAVHERSREIQAARELEDALAAASYRREGPWNVRVQDALNRLWTTLVASRESANAPDSLLSQIVEAAPRLEGRVQQLQLEYGDLTRQVEGLRRQLSERPADPLPSGDTEDLRQRIGWLTTALQHVQAKETELLYEAFQVDIGQGD